MPAEPFDAFVRRVAPVHAEIILAEHERLRAENLQLWARDHARHRYTTLCPICRRFQPFSASQGAE